MRKLSIIIGAIAVFALTACKDDQEIPKAKTVSMSGEWWLDASDADSNFVVSAHDIGHSFLTYNTSDDTDNEIWFDDDGGFWPMKAKMKVDLSNTSFVPGDTVRNIYNEDADFILYEGRIIKGAATAPSGTKTDSMYMVLGFEDYPEVKWTLSGYKDTGWPEDRQD